MPRVRSKYVRPYFLLLLAVLASTADAKGTATAKVPKPPPLAWSSPAAGPTLTGDPELIFTFDDGPDPKRTPFVLDALKAHHIHAIFFMVGARLENPEAQAIVDRILAEGHIIANHTMTHQDLCHMKDDLVANAEIDKGKQIIEAQARMQMVWFRAPYGVRCVLLDDMLAARGLWHFHWDLDPKEWKHNNTKRTIEYLEKNLPKITGRTVLLMHDIKTATVEALPIVLDWLDQENARRRELRIRRIRIIQSYDLAIEKMPAGLLDWLGEAAPDRAQLAQAVASVLP